MFRLGVLADTPNPYSISFPSFQVLEDVFRYVDGIVYAGNPPSPEVLEDLACIAPVQAVSGRRDNTPLPQQRILEIAGVRVGITYGNRSAVTEELYRIRHHFGYSQDDLLIHRLEHLQRSFRQDDLDVLIFGHGSQPVRAWHEGLLLFHPGTINPQDLDTYLWKYAHENDPKERKALARQIRYLRQNPHIDGYHPTVGILEIDDERNIYPNIITLSTLAHSDSLF